MTVREQALAFALVILFLVGPTSQNAQAQRMTIDEELLSSMVQAKQEVIETRWFTQLTQEGLRYAVRPGLKTLGTFLNHLNALLKSLASVIGATEATKEVQVVFEASVDLFQSSLELT